MEEIAGFLARFPPFDRLEEGELGRVAAAVEVRSYRAGEDVLVEDGRPASQLYVIRNGSMELVHQGEVIDILEAGETFGHPSLLTRMAPAFTVSAHDDSVCYLLPRDVALTVLGRPAGASFVATTLRERLTRTGHTVHGLPERWAAKVSDLLHGPPVFCQADSSLRAAAEAMTEGNATAVLVRRDGELGIVTDVDLRRKVVAGHLTPDDPVAAAMTAPVVTVPADRLALDAVVDMLEADVHHLPVVGGSGDVLGVISATDLLDFESQGPFALRRTIAHARDEDALVEVARGLPSMFVLLLHSGLTPSDVGRVLALQSDAVTARLADFAMERGGQAPVAWAWLGLGSVARRELTLASDQDNALAYASADGESDDGYFARLAEHVNAGLARCGFGPDAAEVLARNREWRMSAREWARIFAECFESPDRSHLVRAAVSFDFRHVMGGLEIVAPLVEVVRQAPQHPGFIARLARTATDFKPPLGFRRRLHGPFDIKRGGVIPIANLARFHALANGVTISATHDRLVAAEQVGALDTETGVALREAFAIVSRVRLNHHAELIEAGAPPNNEVDPEALPPLARLDLQEALRTVAEAQKRLAHYVPLGL